MQELFNNSHRAEFSFFLSKISSKPEFDWCLTLPCVMTSSKAMLIFNARISGFAIGHWLFCPWCETQW